MYEWSYAVGQNIGIDDLNVIEYIYLGLLETPI